MKVHEIFKILCFEYRIVSTEYFLDRMTETELVDVIDNLQYTDVNTWEQTRLQIYVLSSMFSKNKLSPQDILTFPWESKRKDATPELPTTISDDDIKRLKEKARLFEQKNHNL